MNAGEGSGRVGGIISGSEGETAALPPGFLQADRHGAHTLYMVSQAQQGSSFGIFRPPFRSLTPSKVLNLHVQWRDILFPGTCPWSVGSERRGVRGQNRSLRADFSAEMRRT